MKRVRPYKPEQEDTPDERGPAQELHPVRMRWPSASKAGSGSAKPLRRLTSGTLHRCLQRQNPTPASGGSPFLPPRTTTSASCR